MKKRETVPIIFISNQSFSTGTASWLAALLPAAESGKESQRAMEESELWWRGRPRSVTPTLPPPMTPGEGDLSGSVSALEVKGVRFAR